MAKKFLWKIWLRLNFLTKDVDNDYMAEVSTVGNTLHNKDIAQRIVEGRSELRFETILSILSERDAVVREALLGGSSTQDENVRLSPQINGGWIGADPLFDPKKHKITILATLTAGLRKALEDVGVELLGKKADGGALIGLVTDLLTGKTDGTVSVSGDIIIAGEKIKVTPTNEAGLGVFFVDADGMAVSLDYPLSENNPKKIICRVPEMNDGEYTLKIVTRYSGSSLLKQPRTIVYELPLKVVS